jgi:HEAT repeat protein
MVRIIFMSLLITLTGCQAPTTDNWLAQLKDADAVNRRQAIRELAKPTCESEPVIAALTLALRDENAYVRRDAAWALGVCGDGGREAMAALRLALQDEAPRVRLAASSALKKMTR